jgi:hypothetical protein
MVPSETMSMHTEQEGALDSHALGRQTGGASARAGGATKATGSGSLGVAALAVAVLLGTGATMLLTESCAQNPDAKPATQPVATSTTPGTPGTPTTPSSPPPHPTPPATPPPPPPDHNPPPPPT